MAVKAQAKYVRTSPRKVREVVDLIRGKSVADARAGRWCSPTARRPATWPRCWTPPWPTPRTTPAWRPTTCTWSAAYVDEGPTLKRWKFRAMGRVNRIRKRSSHIHNHGR